MKNRIFNKMLLTIYLTGAISPKALFFDDTPYCNHVRQRLQKAIQDGYVKEYSYVEKYGTHLRDQSYLALTAKGVYYLSTCPDFPWLQYIPGNIKRVAVFDSPLSASSVAYQVRCGNSINFVVNAGADLTDFVLTGVPSLLPERSLLLPATSVNDDHIEDERIDEKKRGQEETLCEAQESGSADSPLAKLSDIRKETAARLQAAGLPLPIKQNNGMTFYPAKEVRAMLDQYDELHGQTTAFTYIRYTGILVTQNKTWLIYHAKHGGMAWIEKFENNDIRVLKKFDKMCSPKSTLLADEAYGMVLVYNEKNFGDIINNKFCLRAEGTAIGGRFSHFHFVPLSKTGAYLANWLVTYKVKERQEYIASRAYDLCGAVPNRGEYWQGFRLVAGDTLIFDGVEMTARLIFNAVKYIASAAASGKVIQFKVFCFQWQEPFYRKIWPDVEYIYLTE